jgi:hypothetical protein
MYVINSPENILAVYKAPKALDFDPFIKVILGKYGITRGTLSKMFNSSPDDSKNWMEISVDNLKLQLHPGEKSDILQEDLLGCIDKTLTWKSLKGRMVVATEGSAKIVSLYDWCEMVIVNAQTRAFFDPMIYKVCPDLLLKFQLYEDEAWKLPMDFPDFATISLRGSKDYIEKGFIRYLDIPQEQRPDDSWIIRTLCSEMRALGLPTSQEALILFSIYRVYALCRHERPMLTRIRVNANAFKLVFWVISYILFDQILLAELRAEIEPAFAGGVSPKLDYLFESCPLLSSTCEEVLRLTNWPIGTRTVMSESIIGGKRLKVGRKLLMPYRAMHFDSAIFGEEPNTFDPRRFMKRKDLVKSTSYKPFGGAAHYCPGRFIARREVQMFVAIMLKRFELEITRVSAKEQLFPKMDDSLPSGGIQIPAKGHGLILRVQPARA